MDTPITEPEFPQVLALLRQMLVEAGLGSWEIEPWLFKAGEAQVQAHREGVGAYFLAYVDGRPVGMAGALVCEHHAFLSLKPGRHGRVVDEYVVREHRGRGIEQGLKAGAIRWLQEKGLTVQAATPPNVARVAASGGGWRL